MSEIEKNNSQNFNKQTQFNSEDFFCELSIMMHEKLRYTKFISTCELEKLKTCNNFENLNKYFEIEKKILDLLFLNYPNLKNKKKFQKSIKLEEKNKEILSLIEEFVSVDYIRMWTKNIKPENLIGIKIFINSDSKNRHYISDIKILNK